MYQSLQLSMKEISLFKSPQNFSSKLFFKTFHHNFFSKFFCKTLRV